MMKQAWVVLAILLALPLSAAAFPPDKKGDCLDCHKLDKKEAEEIIRRFVPNGVVHDIKLAPVKAFWLIEVESGDRRGMVMLDFTKNYLGQLQPVPKKIDASKVPLKDAVVLGAKNAKKKVIVFTDPDCPYCRKLHDEMKAVTAKRKDIAFHLLLYPLPSHKEAYPKSQAILCEKSIALLDDAFAGKPVPAPKCGNEAVERNLALGQELSVNSTPTLIREDGIVMSGALPADKLIDWVDGK
jgi:thiol:disulfide interchange protein DsbC